jgi:acyl-CoA synthetase (AMP-forming)/AMP-acid ligase II
VRLTWRNVESNARAIIEALGIGPDERAIASLPFHYSYGLSVLNSHLVAGGSVLVTDASVIEPRFWALFDEWRCTSFAGVPYTYEILLRTGFEKRALPSLRTMTQAGGRLHPDHVERFHRWMIARGGRLFVMYGQTEATARIACLPPELLPFKRGAAGRAIPGGELAIESETGSTVSGTGEVVYRGPNVMMGYATERADLARGDELGGVLRTGDLGYLDEDGILFITGRAKRIAKVFGLRVNLDELEGMLRARGPVAAVGAENSIHLHCEFGCEAEFSALAREMAAKLRVNHSAFRFVRVSALPLTANGKVDYPKLQGLR